MSKLILAINAGSSSLKFQLIRMPEEELVTKGLVERIGLKDSIFTIEVDGEKVKTVQDIKDHVEAVDIMLDAFKNIISLMILTISMELVTVLYMVVKNSLNQQQLLMKLKKKLKN